MLALVLAWALARLAWAQALLARLALACLLLAVWAHPELLELVHRLLARLLLACLSAAVKLAALRMLATQAILPMPAMLRLAARTPA